MESVVATATYPFLRKYSPTYY